MGDTKRITIQLDPVAGTSDRWSAAISSWPGFRVLEVRTCSSTQTVPFTQEGGQVVHLLDQGENGLFALIEVESPTESIEAAKLDLDRARAKTEDLWRGRTYGFSIGSAVLTAIVSITVAMIARPPKVPTRIDVDAVHSCRDSLQRLSTLTHLQAQTVGGLSSAIGNHVGTCDPVLEGLITTAAKAEAK